MASFCTKNVVSYSITKKERSCRADTRAGAMYAVVEIVVVSGSRDGYRAFIPLVASIEAAWPYRLLYACIMVKSNGMLQGGRTCAPLN